MLNGAPGIFRPDGSFLDLTASLGGGPGQAIGINDSGMTTGQIDSHPFFHDGTQGEVIRSLTVRGVDINNNGTALLTAAVESSYLYADSQLTPLSGPSGGSLLAFTAINDLRQATGSSFFGSTAKTFVYSDGDYHFIDTFGRSANARDINNQGWIVGSLFDSEGELQGFLNRENETLMLKDLLVPSSAKRWGAINPMAINDHGQIIGVGLFHGYNGDYSRAFVATPVPEPNIVVLMLAGLGVLCFATRCNKRI